MFMNKDKNKINNNISKQRTKHWSKSPSILSGKQTNINTHIS